MGLPATIEARPHDPGEWEWIQRKASWREERAGELQKKLFFRGKEERRGKMAWL